MQKRLKLVEPLDVLGATMEAEALASAIIDAGVLPPKASRDAAHIAVASVHGIEYLLTWNCKHLANVQISRRVARICGEHGFVIPAICTPEELSEESDNE